MFCLWFFSQNRIQDEEKIKKLQNSKSQIEMDFSTLAGNLFELERLITSNNFIMKDAAVKRFIALCEWNYSQYGGIYNDEFIKLSMDFINELTELKTNYNQPLSNRHIMIMSDRFWEDPRNLYSNLKNPFIINEEKEYELYYLKKISVEEYRRIASNYLEKFFQTIESKDHLVLDHFFSNLDSNFDVKSEYLKNLKSILVWRDPRDVYASTILNNLSFHIPADIKKFIKWYRLLTVNQLEGEGVNFKNCLVIRFEDFVLKYDEVSKQIMDFLGLKKENHVDPKGYFKPETSCKTIGLYKKLEDLTPIKIIEKELSKYIYNN